MKWCRWVQKRLVIPEDDTTWPVWVRRHTARCAGCAAFRDRSIQIRSAFAKAQDQMADEAAVQRVMVAIRQYESGQTATEESAALWPVWGLRLAVVGIFAVLLVISYLELPRLTPAHAPVVATKASEAPMPLPKAATSQPLAFPPVPYRFVFRPPAPLDWPSVPGRSWVDGSNIGRSAEFGGVPVMPVSFDH